MAGSHVWVTRFSIVHAHPESGYVYQRYPSTGFRCCNPGARYPYTPSPAAAPISANIIEPRSPGGPHDLCFLTRWGWVIWGTMNPSPSTDRRYIDFNMVFSYKAGTYTAGTRYLRGRY
jgi:hypothetical protein